jgi:hypothetical protein
MHTLIVQNKCIVNYVHKLVCYGKIAYNFIHPQDHIEYTPSILLIHHNMNL